VQSAIEDLLALEATRVGRQLRWTVTSPTSRPNSGKRLGRFTQSPRTTICHFAAGSAYEYEPDTRLTRSHL